jgi:hypothetical protein
MREDKLLLDRLSIIEVGRAGSGAARRERDEEVVVRLEGVVDRLAGLGVNEMDRVGSDRERDVTERSGEGVGGRVG